MPNTITDDCARLLDPLHGCNGVWWVAMTRPKWERRFADDVREAGATPIVVMHDSVSTEIDSKGRRHTRRTRLPLFPCYAFANVDNDEQRFAANRSLATVNLIEVKNQKRLADELRTILRAAEIGSLQPASKLAAGVDVQVIAGPFRGMRGVVIDNKPGTVYLQMTVFQAATAVEMPPEYVEVI